MPPDTRWPSLAIVLGGAMWGLIWLPLRHIGDLGPQLAWPGALVYAVACAMLVPMVVRRRRALLAQPWGLISCGLLTGAAFSLYSTSLFLTDVVRALLLFYLTPVWSTILGRIVLNERITVWRWAALVLGLAGLLVVLAGEGAWPWPRGAGDWLALSAGLCWSLGTIQLQRFPDIEMRDQILAFVYGALVVTGVSIAVSGGTLGPVPGLDELLRAGPAIVLTAIYVLPMLVLTIWPATVLSPGRVGILLMSDVIVGIGSAALLSGEPFGLREGIGTALVISAGVIEIAGLALWLQLRRI